MSAVAARASVTYAWTVPSWAAMGSMSLSSALNRTHLRDVCLSVKWQRENRSR